VPQRGAVDGGQQPPRELPSPTSTQLPALSGDWAICPAAKLMQAGNGTVRGVVAP
jgi:hypothetical protein